VLDPFAGTGSTNLAARAAGRNSIGNEIESSYLKIAHKRLSEATRQRQLIGAVSATMTLDQGAERAPAKAKSIVLPVAGPLP
jgi:site-specific DNA-methyltransferase (adenine-specific)